MKFINYNLSMISKAFSLVELMVVIAIVAILSAVAVPTYKAYKVRTAAANALVFLERFQKEIEVYYQTRGVFPARVGSPTSNTDNHYFFADGSSIGYIPRNGYSVILHASVPSETAYGTAGWISLGAIVDTTNQKLIWYCGAWDASLFTAANLPPGCYPNLSTTPGGFGSTFWWG